jgi:hypothetical protein
MEKDIQHKHGARIHRLNQQIRGMLGYEDFMCGNLFKELAQCAHRNAVVALIPKSRFNLEASQ